jgi:flagellar biosynthesis protein FliQ
MTADLALNIISNMFLTGLTVCGPILGLTMAVGLLVSILQVVTQIQEMSLTFVPKLVVAAVIILAFGSWMLHKISQFTVQLWSSIPSMF